MFDLFIYVQVHNFLHVFCCTVVHRWFIQQVVDETHKFYLILLNHFNLSFSALWSFRFFFGVESIFIVCNIAHLSFLDSGINLNGILAEHAVSKWMCTDLQLKSVGRVLFNMNLILSLTSILISSHIVMVQAIGPLGSFGVGVGSSKCDPSITTASGTYAVHKGKAFSIRS